jgi:L-ascorbate metabolism protein UlaG (beta-lactamase superfamily)
MAKITYYGCAAFTLEENGKMIIMDPWLHGNNALTTIPDLKPDLILTSHAHQDHFGDSILLSKKSGAPIMTYPELNRYAMGEGAKIINRHIGGSYQFEWGSVKLVQAIHSSFFSTYLPYGQDTTLRHCMGPCCGFVIRFHDKVYYHAGDTALFSDMQLWAPVDVAFLPMDGQFSMGPDDAIRAVGFLQAKVVIPMHWTGKEGQDLPKFARDVKSQTKTKCVVLQPYESWEVPKDL